MDIIIVYFYQILSIFSQSVQKKKNFFKRRMKIYKNAY